MNELNWGVALRKLNELIEYLDLCYLFQGKDETFEQCLEDLLKIEAKMRDGYERIRAESDK